MADPVAIRRKGEEESAARNNRASTLHEGCRATPCGFGPLELADWPVFVE